MPVKKGVKAWNGNPNKIVFKKKFGVYIKRSNNWELMKTTITYKGAKSFNNNVFGGYGMIKRI